MHIYCDVLALRCLSNTELVFTPLSLLSPLNVGMDTWDL